MNIDREINKALRRLHASVDLHVTYHQAGVINYANQVRQEIYGSIEHYNRHYGQIRRWRKVAKLLGGGK